MEGKTRFNQIIRSVFGGVIIFSALFSPVEISGQQFDPIGFQGNYTYNVMISPISPNILFAILGYSEVYKSYDYGNNWEQINGYNGDWALDPEDENIYYVLRYNEILKTIDGGNTWFNADSGVSFNADSWPGMIAINPVTPDTLWLGNQGAFPGYFMRSDNGGVSWDNILTINNSPGRTYIIEFNPQNHLDMFIDYEGELWNSSDGGNSWLMINDEFSSIVDLAVDAYDPEIIYAYVKNYTGSEFINQFMVSIDGGNNWIDYSSGLDSYYYSQFEIDNSSDKVFLSQNTKLYYSEISVFNWVQLDSFNFNINEFTLDTINSLIYLSTSDGIYKYNFSTLSITDFQQPIVLNINNYPNPFNSETTIKYDLPEQSHVQLTIFDLLGRKINTLKNQREDAGYYSIKWDGTDENGQSISSGVYIINISAQSLESEETFVQSQKVVLLK